MQAENKKPITVGRICIKLKGKDAGKKFVITEIKENTAKILDEKGKERKANIRHLWPLKNFLEITQDKKELAVKLSQVKINE